ncbi:MAG: AbgT family transporter [Bacteroidales bacterium]|nr:AbgT family transporter [Bacteroidales bacterium]MCF8387294.1 AbgT family transporter [Bacteroidales bacterium]MCF8398728.1 AbgT family transporter [Bacteroidales bacterium]
MLKKRKIPHTYVIIFYIILIAAVMTWFIPGGEYVEKEVVSPDGTINTELEFHYSESQPQTWEVFGALFKGFVKQAGIIVFILMIGGAFWIMNQSKAIDVGIFSFLKYTKKLEKNRFLRKVGVDNILMVLIMLMFSAFGAIFGMSEETIAFIIILVPLAISMGYDSITGVAMVFVAAGLGFAGAILNPFTIGIAQGIAGIPLFSGLEYRLICWIIINIVGFVFILRYASKVKKDPQKSPVYEEDQYWRERGDKDIESIKYHTPLSGWLTYGIILAALIIFSFIYPVTEMKIGNSSADAPMIPISAVLFAITGVLTLRKSIHFFVLSLLLYTIYFLIVGVMGYGWYIMKIATLFFAMGIMAGIAMNYNPDKITNYFLDGVKDILSAAVIVGLAGGIIVILEDGQVIDTILYSLSQSMNNLGNIASVGIMYVIQSIINIIIPSGSAKAAITMPIMAPFSDLIGISRQATVMAFQFGDGFTNMITPTSGVLIGVLGVAKIPYEKWVRWITPMMIVLVILGFLLLIPTVTMNLSGF